jgi:hypothetical protein
MRKILLFYTVLFFSVLRAENVLVLTNPTSGKSHVFKKGSFLVFELKADGSIREGFIREITDSALVFDNAQVSVSQIIILAGNAKGKIVAGEIANAISHGLILSGSILFDWGWDCFWCDDCYYYWPLGSAIWLGGAIIAGIGHLFNWATCPFDYVVRVRNYRGWNATIQTMPSVEKKVQLPTPETTVKEESKKEKEKKKVITKDDVYE